MVDQRKVRGDVQAHVEVSLIHLKIEKGIEEKEEEFEYTRYF
jgi:hypothetical protein